MKKIKIEIKTFGGNLLFEYESSKNTIKNTLQKAVKTGADLMGCYTRTLKEWKKDFWNNTSEFPDDGSIKSQLRVMAYEVAIKWIKINK